ncbi:TonB-dependent hemoglobin/transferrin/lactoferrin family receptor [Shewanella sp. 10N.286.52.B9]|uniref:TonB-dependent hemoglobin/transferrin/lactoferrin family receptor n=1 Tax=Shewanella sp. 10N.286.52.B9 TaxID=1880837 RepID=UPI000C81E20F|nr:TonB-dependent hemoglobin/transferrin/lactoferrin family receptor [Shewanella sp. 10N.286.52.B9]PMG42241.1 TonB-dependent receptor [Shewanella sp. 10N.286.52.B9]
MKQLSIKLISAAIAAALSPQVIADTGEIVSQEEIKQSISNFHDVIVISGSRMEQTLDQVAGSVVVIDEESIARNMSTDFASLFRTEAAVDVKGGAGKPSSVTIRGIGGNRVMMVKDGVRVNNQYASPLGPGAEGTGRGLTEVEGLKQVEVLKTAASTMYGSDALGGVMVMTTKDADDYLRGSDYYFSANGGYTGMNDEFSGGFTSAFAAGDFDNLVSYQRRSGEEQQNYYNTLPDSDLVTDSLLLKSKYHFNDDTNLQLTVDYMNQQLDRWEKYADKGDMGESIDYDRQTQALNTSLRLRSTKDRIIHDNVDFVLYYGKTDQSEKRDYFNGISGADRAITQHRDYQFDEYRFGFASTFSKALSLPGHDHNIIYGVDVEQSEMSRPRDYQDIDKNGNSTPSETDTFSFADTKSLRAGLFIQDDMTFLDGKLNGIVGLRYDYFKNTPDQQQAEDAGRDPEDFAAMSDGFWSPKLGLVYHMTENVNVYAQYAYGYKMPTPDQKWGELEVKDGAMPFPVIIQANYDLESESSNTIEVGVRGDHGDTQYEFTTFYTQADNYIDWEFVGMNFPCDIPLFCPMPESLNYRYINYDEVTLYGAEMSMSHWFTDEFELWGNIAYTHGEDQNGDYLNSVSPLKGNLGANYYTYLGNTEADFGLTMRFADQMDRTTNLDIFPGMDTFNQVYNTAGYAVFDLTANFHVNDNWTVRAGVFNLFDKEYIEYSDVAGQSKFLMDIMDVTEETYSQPGRYFNVKLSYTF